MIGRLFATGLRLEEDTRVNGQRVLRSSVPLRPDRPDILERLRHWATTERDRVLLTEPVGSDRRAISYSEAFRVSGVLNTLLAERYALRPGDRLATLAPAGVDALLLKLACLQGGYVHVALPPFPFREGELSPANQPFLAATQPSLIVAPTDHAVADKMGALNLSDLVAAARATGSGTAPPRAEHAASDWAAIFFTSGSTGARKAVPITRGMISSNQAAIAAFWPFIAEQPPVLVDWLPWHHVFGGLDNIFKVIWNGGVMHVDAAPSEATMGATMRLVAAVAPTMHIAVPLGIKLLLDVLERDVTAVRAFTRNLQAVFFAGAGIDASLWSRLRRFRDACGSFEILSGYGTTEAASTICLSPAPLEQPGELGHPLPGHEVLLAEAEGRLELRVRGPNVAPGYLTAEGLVPLSLDEGGFYRTGDAALVRRRADGQTVLGFDGRLAEDFKLSSGVKVHTGWLRERLIAHCAPLAEDIVVAGENRDSLVALVLPATSCIADPDLIEKLSRALAAWNESNRGSSTSIARFALAAAAPDRSRGEVSDKGQIVRNRFLRNHAAFFEALHAGEGRTPAA